MPTKKYLLVINPGSTSTRLALFQMQEAVELFRVINVQHPTEELTQFAQVSQQYDYRLGCVEAFLQEHGEPPLAAVVGRGGLLRPIPSGTYLVNDAMVCDLQQGIQGEHASNLGGLLAKGMADPRGIPAYIVDPVSVDEFTSLARLSGLPQLPRISLGHTLNIRAVARRVAAAQGKLLSQVNFVVAHLGGGISVSPLQQGRLLDYNDANQAGPFSPERAGSLPVKAVIDLAFSGKYTLSELRRLFNGQSGLVGYLGSNDARQAVARAEAGDAYAALILDALAYQVAKEIGAMATVLAGKVDAIILTGGLAHATYLAERIADLVKYIAPIEIEPGEDEMQALAEGAWQVLAGNELVQVYGEGGSSCSKV